VAELHIGTCGYDYPEWRGVFYPATVKRSDFLAFYATRFNAVEIDFTFYTLPTERHFSEMAARSGGHLRFSVKGNQAFTHAIGVGTWQEEAAKFRRALVPLQKDGLLASVLLQFPQSFYYEKERRIYLDRLIAAFREVPLVVEFRNDTWHRQSVYEGLHERGVGLCACDMPALSRLPRFRPAVAAGRGYVRFHGRNRRNWYNGSVSERYDYCYSDAELAAYKPALAAMRERSQTLQIYFNNHARGQAALNAQKMMKVLEE